MSLNQSTSQPFMPVPAYCALPRSPETWIVEHLCPVSGLLNLFGAPKGGKSFLAMQLAAAVSDPSINDWMSFPIRTHGVVLYLQLDTPRSLWGQRMDQFSGLGFDLSNVYVADAEQAPYPFDILGTLRDPVSPSWTYLRDQVIAHKPILVIIDTLREIHSGDENKSDQMHNVMANLISACHPSAVCVISHSRKDNVMAPEGQRENLLDDNRGSNYISGRMDGIIRTVSTTRKTYLSYQSRTIERAILKCRRYAPGLWAVDCSEEDAIVHAILSNPQLTTMHARVDALVERTGKSPDACRSRLRRVIAQLAAEDSPVASQAVIHTTIDAYQETLAAELAT